MQDLINAANKHLLVALNVVQGASGSSDMLTTKSDGGTESGLKIVESNVFSISKTSCDDIELCDLIRKGKFNKDILCLG